MIKLLKNLSDRKVVSKNITDILTLTAYELIDVDVVSPSFICEYDSRILDANYIFYDTTDRYYYISEVKLTEAGQMHIRCSVDVLMSFAAEIRKCKATIDRNEKQRNGYLNDNRYQAYAYSQIVAKKFPHALEDDSIILMTVG